MSDSTTSKKSEEDICVICYTKPEYPKGRLACEHVYCWACIRDWLKKRSQCPLCQIQVHRVQKLTKGRIETKLIRERTTAHYLNELEEGDEAEEREHEAVDEAENTDISVIYARCSICSKSDNEDKLMLCDAILYGRGPQAVTCNAAFHCYCLENGTEQPPEGQFICPFCTNAQLEREEDVNVPGPSRVQVRDGGSRGTSNRRTRELPRSRSASTIQEFPEWEMSSEECDSETSLEYESEADEDWSEADEMVLSEDSDPQPGYSGWGRTAVTRTRRKIKKVSKNKKSTPSRSKKEKTRSKRPAPNASSRVVRSPPKAQRNVKRTRKVSKDEPAQQENVPHEASSHSSIDLMASIIAAQTRTLAPSCCKRVLRDGSIEETEAMTKYIKKLAKRKKPADVMNAQLAGRNLTVSSIPLPTGPPLHHTVNNILAAGLLGNVPLGPPGMSQAPGGSSFVLPGQMQMATAHNPQLTQQLSNLAQLQAGNTHNAGGDVQEEQRSHVPAENGSSVAPPQIDFQPMMTQPERQALSDYERAPLQKDGRRATAYKTSLCLEFKERHFCSYGNGCRFAHGVDELQPPAKLTGRR